MLNNLRTRSLANTKTIKSIMTKKRIAILSVLSLSALSLAVSPVVFADRFQEQINELNNQNAAKQEGLNTLDNEAASLQDKIAKLQADISNLQVQIQANEAKKAETLTKIADAEAKLVQNKQYLSDNIKAMYVDGEISSLEMLASSQDLNDFVDKDTYQKSVQAKIQEVMDTIKALRTQLDTEKTNLERMIADQQDMRNRVSAQQAEQARLLSLNQAQQNELDGQIKDNRSKITDLR